MHRQSPEFMMGILVGALVAGALCGLLPLSIAISRKRVDLAIGSMVACIVCGFCGGLLIAAPAAVILATAIFAFTSRPREHPEEALNYTAYYREYAEPVDDHLNNALAVQTTDKPKAKKTSGPAVRCSGCGRDFWPGLGPTPPWCQGCGADLRVADPPKPATPATQDMKAPSPEAIMADRPV
jgi:hypothetical protein